MSLISREYISISQLEPQFKIMTWNILADQLATDFPKVNPEFLQWNYRKDLIVQEIERIQPDIICLQELDHFDFIKSVLEPKGYLGIFQKKVGWHHDGSAIFYLASKFEKIETFSLSYPGNQFAIGILFQGPERFYVFTTHLKAKDNYDSVRCQQIECLFNFLRNLERLPILLCGDFNSRPGTNAYNKLNSNDLGLLSVYKQETEPEYTTVKFRTRLEIKTEDYIFQRGFTVTSILSLPSLEEIGSNGLPSQNYPSDHLALSATISF